MVSPLASIVANARPQTNAGFGQYLQGLRQGNEQIAGMQQKRELQAEQAGMNRDQVQRQEQMAKLQFVNRLGKKLLSTDQTQWGQLLQPQLPILQQMGYDVSMIDQLNPETVEAIVAQTDAVLGDQGVNRDSVQSSDILPGGAVIKVMRSGRVVVEDSQGNPLTGNERQAVIDEAERRKIELAGEKTRTVEGAKTEIKTEAKRAEESRKNEKSYRVYQVAFDNLTNALGGASSGAIVGRIPATTTNAQIAENARDILLPSLKSIFREAGEGTFTDSDQRALENLIPNRTMTREAQIANLQAIDALVKAKLGIQNQQETQQGNGMFSQALGRAITEQDIKDTLQSNPGVTREQLLNQLQVQNGRPTR